MRPRTSWRRRSRTGGRKARFTSKPRTGGTRSLSRGSSTSSASLARDASASTADSSAGEGRRTKSQAVRALVERAQLGHRDALEELYLIHFDRIYSYLH